MEMPRRSWSGCFRALELKRFSRRVKTASWKSMGAFWSSCHVSLYPPMRLVLWRVRRHPSTWYRSSMTTPFVLASHCRSHNFCHCESCANGTTGMSSFSSLCESRAFSRTNRSAFSLPMGITFVSHFIIMPTCSTQHPIPSLPFSGCSHQVQTFKETLCSKSRRMRKKRHVCGSTWTVSTSTPPPYQKDSAKAK